MNKRCFFVAILFAFLANNAFAKDPISWRLDQTFPNPVLVAAATYSVQYTLRNELPLTLVNPLKITHFPSSAEFTFVDNCTSKKLTPNETCTVGINLVPTVAGKKSVYIVIEGYDKNQVPLPALTTIATANTGITIIGSTVTPLPATMQLNESANYRFRFTNNGTNTATGVTVTSNYVDFLSTCGAVLEPGAFCEVSGSFEPVSSTPATQVVSATFDYAQGSPVTVSTSTTIVIPTLGLIGELIAGADWNPVILQGQVAQLTFRFTNTGTNIITGINQNNTYPANPIFIQTSGNCPNTLNPGDFCDVIGTFTAPNPAPAAPNNCYDVAVELVPGTNPPPPVTVLTSTCVVAPSAASRTITLVNRCDFPVWFSLNGAKTPNNMGGSSCTIDTDCPGGSICSTGSCYWPNYAPADGNFRINQNNTTTVDILDAANPAGLLWSGGLSASTGCNGTRCVTANCENDGGDKACKPNAVFMNPTTQAQFIFQNSSADTYFVDVSNGFNIPISVSPNTPLAVNGYTCGRSGFSATENGFGSCNWDLATVPDANYNWVTNEGPCDGSCFCGRDSDLNQVCGKFLGFWTAKQACSVNPVLADPYFHCNTFLGAPYPPSKYTLSNLYQCSTPKTDEFTLDSCYKTGTNATCCGCVNWSVFTSGTPDPIVLPATQDCVNNTNPWWVRPPDGNPNPNNVQDTLIWMKRACPNYKSYPFDTASSQMNCQKGTPNIQGYTVVFCDGTITGLPENPAQEGRGG